MITDEKKRALQQFLSIPDEDIDDIKESQWNENSLEIYNKEYLVLTDAEADDEAAEEIKRTLWAFRSDFILHHCNNEDMDNFEWDCAKEALESVQSSKAEGANGLVRALISDLDEFINDAICEDGRGRFIAYYDGYENEEVVDGVTYYIYRTN